VAKFGQYGLIKTDIEFAMTDTCARRSHRGGRVFVLENHRKMRKTPNGAGYRRPPKEHCWKKGQSGNPRGRPPGMRNLAAALTAVLHENVSMCADGEEREMTKLEAVTRQLVDKAMAGDARVMQQLLNEIH
jgi:hypothetical protein